MSTHSYLFKIMVQNIRHSQASNEYWSQCYASNLTSNIWPHIHGTLENMSELTVFEWVLNVNLAMVDWDVPVIDKQWLCLSDCEHNWPWLTTLEYLLTTADHDWMCGCNFQVSFWEISILVQNFIKSCKQICTWRPCNIPTSKIIFPWSKGRKCDRNN